MPGLLNFLADPESQRAIKNGLLDAANRGMVASTLGGPVDLATTVANLGISGAGYLGHKAGLLDRPPELINPLSVPGSSEWIGQKMQNAGMVTPNRNALAEAGMGLLSPVAFKGAQKVGGLLYNVEQNALANASKPSTMRMQGQRGIFAGEWAKTADKNALSAAKKMEADKADPRAIWSETGWFKGPDGKWRFEIDDSGADVPMFKKYWRRPLDESIVHDPLEAAYPDVKNIMFEASPGGLVSGAQYSPNAKFHDFGEREAILIRNSDESLRQNKSLALHELQHAIQGREGFAKGGNPASFPDAETLSTAQLLALRMRRGEAPSVAAAWLRKNTNMNPSPQAFDLAMGDKDYLRKLGDSPNDAYMRLAGEAEARAVQSRMNMSEAQRRASFPLDSYDVPLDSLIIKY